MLISFARNHSSTLCELRVLLRLPIVLRSHALGTKVQVICQPRSQGPLSSYLEKVPFLEVGRERTLGTRLVICPRSKRNVSVFRILLRQHEHKKQN